MRLSIPRIKVDAAIESVGLTADGAMGVPQGPADAAWFNLGAIPGEQGTAVIDGHSGWANNIPAVLDDLYKLKKGDSIIVTDAQGVATTFIVRDMHTYDPNADAATVFTSTDGASHLNLITCAGDWNPTLKTHSSRLVVFADKK
ncbi:MAG: peptidase family protein [Candidatus Nomurabacteria bacterium]|nr:peptidase family protein [Candidatus Nomurabacteria bacterium]